MSDSSNLLDDAMKKQEQKSFEMLNELLSQNGLKQMTIEEYRESSARLLDDESDIPQRPPWKMPERK